MGKIVALEVFRREVGSRGLVTTYGPVGREAGRQHVFVRAVAEDGTCGYGEASCLTPFTGETPESVEVQLREHVAPLVVGRDALAVERLHERLSRELPHNPTALAAVDVAAHDLAGRLLGVPVGDLLGGRLHRHLPTADGIGADLEPAEAAEEARRLLARGARALKLKVGLDLDRDVRATAAVREAVGPAVPLRLDANGGLDVAAALELARATAPFRPQYLEQPVPGWDVDGLAEVRRRSPIPVAADESCTDLRSVARLLQLRAADYLVIKLVKAGGLTPARQMARLAAAFGVRCTVTSPFETSIGLAANLHLAATMGNLSGPVELGVPEVRDGDPAAGPDFGPDGFAVPDGPGLGVSVRADAFAGARSGGATAVGGETRR